MDRLGLPSPSTGASSQAFDGQSGGLQFDHDDLSGPGLSHPQGRRSVDHRYYENRDMIPSGNLT